MSIGKGIRQLGTQQIDVLSLVKPITKYKKSLGKRNEKETGINLS